MLGRMPAEHRTAVRVAGTAAAVVVLATGAVAAPMTDTELTEALRRHVAALSVDIGERTSFHPDGLARAGDFVRGALEDAGLEVTDQSYAFRGIPVANLVADLPGGSGAPAYYLVGAHYDTVPGTPGADDNASGVAVLIELARRLVADPPSVPVRFAAFTLEEPPAFGGRFQGSRVFVERAMGAGERVAGAVVLEMVGYTAPRQDYPMVLRWAGYPDSGDFIGVVANRGSRRFGEAVVGGLKRNPRLPVESLFVPFNGWILPDTRLSDHASFWDQSWPAVMVTDTAFFRNPNYHGPGDGLRSLDFAFMAELVAGLQMAIDALPALADAP